MHMSPITPVRRPRLVATTLAAALATAGADAFAASYTYTSQGDWGGGLYNNTNSNEPPVGHVKLDDSILTPFNHIWVAASGRGTVIRINTDTGAVLGEYFTAPGDQARDPSRTTVDANGDVWVGNRAQGGGALGGSVAKISANAGGPGTSTGVFGAGTGAAGTFDARPWTNAGGVDTDGGTDTAADDAILQYVRLPGTNNVRALAVDANNDVWVGGNDNFNNGVNHPHVLIDGDTGTPVGGAGNSFTPAASAGGYGMVVDGNGVVWAASLDPGILVKHDPATNTTTNISSNGKYTYGLAVDNNGKIWVSNWVNNTVQRYNPVTNVLELDVSGHASGLRGVAVTADNDIWVAASNSGGVTRLNNDGSFAAFIGTGSTPTGVAVDSSGKVWVTNFSSNTVSRIDPATNLVDLTVPLGAGANPYNYSDMTGSVLFGTTIGTGTWRDVLDSGSLGTLWDSILWNTEAEGSVPAGTGLLLEARVCDDLNTCVSAYQSFNSGDLLNLVGRYLDVRATFTRQVGVDDTAILSDLTINWTPGGDVPEPGSLALLGLGGLLLGSRWRRRMGHPAH